MTPERVGRKLAAILSADVKGYSRLMRGDEVATVDTLKAYREAMSTLIQSYRGRVVDSPGDNILAEFGSVVDAVECAVEIQKELKAKNAELPENRRMEFRIGINLGDVIEDGERIYGDGVNIAARVEGLAEGGGICISGTVYENVKNKLTLGYQFLGDQKVKNISEPVRVYRVLMEPEAAGKVIGEKRPAPKRWQWVALSAVAAGVAVVAVWYFALRPSYPRVEPASVERMPFPLPDRPSIAVLPFENMTGDPEQEYIADGFTENVITALSKIPEMFVIARNSTFTYKGKPVKIRQASEELGVRYVLEGSVQKADDRLRITAQLIDALEGDHLWAERYDRELKDLFVLQDEITMKILTALEVELTRGEMAREYETENLEAWGYLVRAYSFFGRVTKEDNAKARELVEQALKLDPDYPSALVVLGRTHIMAARMGWSESPAESVKQAFKLGQKAVALRETEASGHRLLVSVYTIQKQYDMAIAEGERAVALGPNDAEAHGVLAYALHYAGRFEDAIVHIEKAMRLQPHYPAAYLMILADSYFMVGRYNESIAANKQLLDRARRGEFPLYIGHMNLAVNYMLLGQEEEGRAHAAELLRTNPSYSLEALRSRNPYKDPAHLERWLSALRKAGIPEHPPLPLPDKPSIAVLPFVNMSDDPKQEYFSDGITEEIITALSKTPKLFVIARNSSFTYKGKPVKVQEVGRDLGVRYVLEGSVRKAGDRVRITAQLVDATTGNHLWAERYDRELKDVFAIQDEITMKVIEALQVKLTEGEQARIIGKSTDNLEAYLLLLQAVDQNMRMTKDANILSRQLAEQAIALDPNYAAAYRVLAHTYWVELPLGVTKDPRRSVARAMEHTQKSIALDNSSGMAHSLLGWLYTIMRQHEKGVSECELGVELDPNSAPAYLFLAMVLRFAGRYEEAIAMHHEAIRLDPIPASIYYHTLSLTYCLAGRYEEAITEARKSIRLEPNSIISHIYLAIAYNQTAREDEARLEAKEVLRINPKFSLERWAKNLPCKHETDKDMIIGALRKAGLK